MTGSVLAALAFGAALAWFIGSGRRPSRISRIARLSQQSQRAGLAVSSQRAAADQRAAKAPGAARDSRADRLGFGTGRDSDPKRQAVVSYGACGVAALAAVLLIGGVLGYVVAAAAMAVGPRFLGSLETKSTRIRRERILSDAPLVAELMAACLQAGVSDQRALRSVVSSLDGPVVTDLGVVLHALTLGTDPEEAWQLLDHDSPLAPIARAFARSAQSGAPLSQLLASVAQELRAKHAAAVETAARSVAVKSVGPLGLCFLPAFILLGVVPLVASLFTQVSPF